MGMVISRDKYNYFLPLDRTFTGSNFVEDRSPANVPWVYFMFRRLTHPMIYHLGPSQYRLSSSWE